MGWAERKIQQYNQGEKASWLERRVLEHANPVHLGLYVLGAIPLIYGLWVHNWTLIAVGVLLNFIGHLYGWLKK
jgi:hypothetical protein